MDEETQETISINAWRLMSPSDKKIYEYVSDASGCYFIKKAAKKEADETIDDFERLTKKER